MLLPFAVMLKDMGRLMSCNADTENDLVMLNVIQTNHDVQELVNRHSNLHNYTANQTLHSSNNLA